MYKFEGAEIVFESPQWRVVRIRNKEEAIKFGRPQWCTARPDNRHYENLYANGELLALFKNTKERPQYQLFVNKPYVEFKDGGNLKASIPLMISLYAELEPFFTQFKVFSRAKSIFSGFEVHPLFKLMPKTARFPYSDEDVITAAKKKLDIATMMDELSSVDFVPERAELPVEVEAGAIFYIASEELYAVGNNRQYAFFKYRSML